MKDTKFFSSNINEVAYLMARGAEIVGQRKASANSRWFIFQLENIDLQWVSDFNNLDSYDVSVAQFLKSRDELKYTLSTLRDGEI